MKKSRDYFALDWIKAELDQTLAAARLSLEEYAQPDRDKTRMRACLTHLHQVHGTLVMLELGGVAVLADEMEQLAQALSNGTVANVEGAQQVLMQGILQLPAFLEEIQKGLPDSRRAVLPLANELRAARGEDPFPESPGAGMIDLRAPAGEDTLTRFKDIDGVEKARKIRAAYQQVLLAILRGDYGPKVVGTLTKVAVGLERICERTPLAALWRAFGVFVKSLEGEARLSSDVVKLLRRVDAELKVLATDGRTALARPLSTELVRALVDATSSRGFRSTELDELASALSDASGEGSSSALQSSGIAGNQALQTAALALREELASVKDQLDLLVRSGEPNAERLRELSAPLKRIGSTLSVLGFESSRAIVSDQVDAIAGIAANGRADESVVMSIAAALLQVDENLTAVTEQRRRPVGVGEPSAIIDDAQLAVLAEARNGLEHVKQCVVDYVSSHWDKNKLSDVPGLLGAVRGALTIVTLARPAELLARCTVFVERELLAGKVPDWATLDTFADAISGVDYYLERLCEQTSPGDDIIARVERSVASLESARLGIEPPALESVEAREEHTLGRVFDDNTPEDARLLEDEEIELTAPPEQTITAEEEPIPEAPVLEERVDDAQESRPHIVPMHAARLPASREETESFELVLEDEDDKPSMRLAAPPKELEFDLSSEIFDDLSEPEVPTLRQGAPKQVEPKLPPEPKPQPAPVLRVVSREVPAAPVQPASVTPKPTAAPVADTPPVTPLPAAARAPSVDEPDSEIIEIFAEEVAEVLDTLDDALVRWSGSKLGDVAALKDVRRAFHTLKGSGRIVGAKALGELSWSVENMLNRVLDDTLPLNPQILTVVREARALVPGLRDAFQSRTRYDEVAVARVGERADLLASGGELQDLAPATAEQEPEPRLDEPLPTPIVDEVEPDRVAAPFDEARTLFIREFAQLLETIDTAREREPTGEAVVRALHTVRGSASMAGVANVDRLVNPVYETVLAAIDAGVKTDPELGQLLARGAAMLRRALTTLSGGGNVDDTGVEELEAASQRIVARFSHTNTATTPLVMLDGVGVLMDARDFIRSWYEGALDLSQLAELVAALHEVRNQAESQQQRAVVQLCDALVSAHERLEDQPLAEDAFEALDSGHDLLLGMFDRIAAQQAPPPHAAVLAALNAAGVSVKVDDEEEEPSAARDSALREKSSAARDRAHEEEPSAARDSALEEEIDAPTARVIEFPQPSSLGRAPTAAEPPAPIVKPEPAPAPLFRAEPPKVKPPVREERFTETVAFDTTVLPADVDPEILDIFFEESDELLETLDHGIHEWLVERDNQVHLENLLRALHTLKGGARLAGLPKLGDDVHAFESFLGDTQSTRAPTDGFFRALQKSYDDLTSHVSRLRTAAGRRPADAAPVPAPMAPQPIEPALKESGRHDAKVGALKAEPTPRAPAAAARTAGPARADAEREEAPAAPRPPSEGREMVRVSAGLLEQLVNLAGESSIVRSRIEQGISDFAVALEEMETTIERVREQLRRLEIETEARVLYRHERHSGPHYEHFDPLEMDRYSQLQQLSRGLSESASDMLDLKETLSFKSRESETLLIQQARINTELQEGLMRTRMVPFSRLVPRLRRIVRQVSSEVGKEAELSVYNAEGELDRNVLERMVPPLEHMLRNAIDHGIETPELRRNFGKTDLGRIDLRLSREAGDVVIEISDDGAGIDVESVRAKAVERSLMAGDARLSDDEVLQFIFAPGFSTAKSVTQISGRGVGMDVVHSTVKQLGGSIQITSVPGKGTRFTVRLPFTVSVNRALMVSISDDLYAVPLNTIEGIVRVSAAQLDELYSPSGGGFEYAGVQYRVRYLGSYIGREYKPRPEQGSVPVVLLRAGDVAMAVHVDGVAGSREIVVKSLGPQFAGVAGVSGATILGDGSVVVILDLLALVRAQTPVHHHVLPPLAEKRDRPRCVMVVDDSVTVRKVTSRLLERQGMDVMVAKDGVEAIAMLQERRPDIVLLDIEMPRMDGFEVARQIRHDDRLSKLPIVMISSRTGAKHQEHAVELGVNRFLGKPFQESELLSTIDELVD